MFDIDKCECNAECDYECMCNWVVAKEWQGLTDDEVSDISARHRGKSFADGLLCFYRDIEAKLKEKNHVQ